MWMELENGQGEYLPRKHTINVKPAERLSVLINADVARAAGAGVAGTSVVAGLRLWY